MKRKTILHLHGFASSAHSTKAQFLREKVEAIPEVDFHAIDLNPTPRDFETMTVTGCINRLRQYVLDYRLGTVCVTASSMGALVGLNYAHRFGGHLFGGVEKMFLLAPALVWLSGGLRRRNWHNGRGSAPSLFSIMPLRNRFPCGMTCRSMGSAISSRSHRRLPSRSSTAYATTPCR